ncbi:MAG: HAMP domain-containing sensor histidine kinase [Lachnospiraceae bacterium]|nr:HAMP domain-containing sensor histidine kinase [Lachnospiraceae bacterium]
MKRSLYYKFILGYVVFGLLGFLLISTFSSKMAFDYLLQEKAELLYDEASQLASDCSAVYNGETTSLETVAQQLCVISPSLQSEIWVVNRNGTIVADSNDGARRGLLVEFDPTAIGNRNYGIGNFYGAFPYDVLSVSAPIAGNYTTYGYILIHMPISQIQTSRDWILNVVYITSAILFLLSLIILLIFTQTVFFPLKKISRGVDEYASGNLEYRIKLSSHDEMGYLAETLNYMSDKLNQMEEYQKTFIANVSHDFRSPLTSIKGYLEAIIDGTIPPEMQEKYLTRVITETERLNKLTQGMLTLNTLDSKGLLSRTNFDINRVIKDTAASFEVICNQKNLSFDLTFADSIQMVYADMGKIQQVLYNLIDNAIKFSHSNSTIYIQASPKYEKIFISVKDTGIGIPKNSLKKIWERFYKTDLSRGKDKKGTGLGLSIVKEIIQAHGENIDVVSTEGVGSEFIFSLPRSTNL